MPIIPVDNEKLTKDLLTSAMKGSVEEVIFLIKKGANADEALAEVVLKMLSNEPSPSSNQDPINLLISNGADKDLALALVAYKGSIAGIHLLVSKGANRGMALAKTLERGDICGANLLISQGANKEIALAHAALKGDIAALDLLVSKGADKDLALALVAAKGLLAGDGLDLLINKGANINKALEIINKEPAHKNKVATVNLLTSKAHEKLVPLAIKNGGVSAVKESEEESVSDNRNDHTPDGGSSGANRVREKRSYSEIKKYQEEEANSYSINQSSSSSSNSNAAIGYFINNPPSSSNSNKAAKTDSTESASSKKPRLNSSENQHNNAQQNKQKEVDKESLPSKAISLVTAALQGNEVTMNLLISQGANKSLALALAAAKKSLAGVDLLIIKGANKSLALALVAAKKSLAGVDLLISKGADIYEALEIIKKEPDHTHKIDALNLLTIKANEKTKLEKLVPFAIKNGDVSVAKESKEESVSDSGNDHAPDDGSSGTISYSINQSSSSSSSSNKAAKTDITESARSKTAKLNSSENQNRNTQQNKQKEVDKELLSSEILAHAALKGYVPVSKGDHTSQDLAHNALKAKPEYKTVSLATAALQSNVAAMDLLISEGANKEKALVRVALQGSKVAIDLLISKGANKNIAYILLTLKGKSAVLNLLRSKGASDEEALANVDKVSSVILNKDDKINAKKLLKNNIHKKIELEKKSISDSGSDSGESLVSTSDSEDDNTPDGGSSGAIIIGVNNSSLGIEKDIAINYSINQYSSSSSSSSSSSDSNKIAKTGSTVSKRSSLNGESNSIEDQSSDIQQNKAEKKLLSSKASLYLEIKTKLKDQIIYKHLEERDLEDAEKEAELVARNENQNIIRLSKDISEDYLPESTAEKQVKIYDNQEISQLYQLGKWVYSLIENAINSPLMFTDKSGGLGAYSLYDDGLPKMNMDSPFLYHIDE